MPDPGVRKRKASAPSAYSMTSDSKPTPEKPRLTNNNANALPTLVYYAGALLAIGAFVFLYPSLVAEFLDAWIGFSDWEETQKPQNVTYIMADIEKRNAVVSAFKHAWSAYARDAMGADEYHPISRKGSNLTDAGGIGYTVVDSIDTMLLMGLTGEYTYARAWVRDKMELDRDANFNTFETTIRVLGGLLSAYHFSNNDPLYLERAVELADRMLPGFNTPSGLPLPQINLKKRQGVEDKELPGLVSVAEVSTLQLEYRYLSYLTGNEEYWEKAENVMATIKRATLPHGLASIFMTIEGGQFIPSAVRLGSRGDSYYEYLLKQYLQTNSTENVYREMYDVAMDAIHKNLFHRGTKTNMLYTAELVPEQNNFGQVSWRLTPKQDHLVCFLGGSLMLGAVTAGALVHPVSIPPKPWQLTEIGQRDWESGIELIQTCMNTHDTATGLAPEIVYFRIPSDNLDNNQMIPQPMIPQDWYIKGARPGAPAPYDARYILRPETVESLFLAYRLTGDNKYRNFGWKIFQAIEKHCRIDSGGYASIINVDDVPVTHEDKMETFLLSETFKYLYLLFDDGDTLPLNRYVLNTEAHPLPIFMSEIRTRFS